MKTSTQHAYIRYLEATFAVVVWGASFVATKIVLKETSPVTLVWLRFAMGVAILGITVAARGQFALPSGSEWGYFVLLGFLGITFHQWLQSNGLVTAEASTTAWIVATIPVFMAILGWLALKEKLDWSAAGGIILAALGVLLVVSKGNLANVSLSRIGTPGDLLILLSAPNWAVFSILSRRGLQKHPAARMMFYVMSLGWLFTSVLFFTSQGFSEIPEITFRDWLGISFLGIFCSGLAYIAWYDALQELPASQVGVFLYIEPLVTLFVAAALLGEAITPASLLGGGIILLGVYMVNRKTII